MIWSKKTYLIFFFGGHNNVPYMQCVDVYMFIVHDNRRVGNKGTEFSFNEG